MEGAATAKGEGFLSRMALNDNKAGMEGLDRDKINTIIMEASKVNINHAYLCTTHQVFVHAVCCVI